MRDYSKISASFWTGQTGRALRGDAEAQIVALYLLTSPHANMIGVYTCPIIYISHETGLPFEGALKGLRRLCEVGFCSYDEDSEIVWVHEMAVYQIGESLKPADNRVKDVQKQFDSIPQGLIKTEFFKKYGYLYQIQFRPGDDSPSKPLRSPFEAPSKPGTGTGTGTGTGDKNVSRAAAASRGPGDASAAPVDQSPAADASSVRKKRTSANRPDDADAVSRLQELCRLTWDAYREAHVGRYGVEPVRNAKVNASIVGFVKRLGSEAPAVAGFYVRHDAPFYVKSCHSVGVMLQDAEKLHTEWASGIKVAVVRQLPVAGASLSEKNAEAIAKAKERIFGVSADARGVVVDAEVQHAAA